MSCFVRGRESFFLMPGKDDLRPLTEGAAKVIGRVRANRRYGGADTDDLAALAGIVRWPGCGASGDGRGGAPFVECGQIVALRVGIPTIWPHALA